MGRLSLSITVLAFLLACEGQAYADYKFGFFDVNLNRLDWTTGTKLKSTKQDFTYLEFEGGSEYSWGELYGFFDIENVGKSGDEVRTATKGSVRYYIPSTPLSLYAHVYNFTSLGFSEQNQIVGLGYQLKGPAYWLEPFLGFHEVSQTFYSGFNGYMGGWTLGYGFKIFGLDFLLTDWHEFEFARNSVYAAGNGGSTTSHNGAAAIWWNINPHYTTGFQWRYAQDKLGTPGTLGAEIFTFKYVF